MTRLAIKVVVVLVKIIEHRALKTANMRLLDQVVVVWDALNDAGWTR